MQTEIIENTDIISTQELKFRLQLLKNNFLKRKLYFLYILFFSIILSIFFSKFIKPKYIANLTFTLEEEKSQGLSSLGSGAAGIASQFGIDLGGASSSAFSGINLIELMKSEKIICDVLLSSIKLGNDEMTYADYFIKLNNYGPEIDEKYSGKNLYFQLNTTREKLNIKQNRILKFLYYEILKNNISILQKDKKISIINIGVTSKNEIFSKNFCEQIASKISEYYIQIKTKKAKSNVDILQKQVDSVRLNLNGSLYKFASSSDNIFNINPSMNVGTVNTNKVKVDVQANSTILMQLLGNLEIAKLNLRKETPLIQIIDRPYFPLNNDKKGFIFYFFTTFVSLISVFVLILVFEVFTSKMNNEQ